MAIVYWQSDAHSWGKIMLWQLLLENIEMQHCAPKPAIAKLWLPTFGDDTDVGDVS